MKISAGRFITESPMEMALTGPRSAIKNEMTLRASCIRKIYMNLVKARLVLAILGNYQATIVLAITTLLILKFLMVRRNSEYFWIIMLRSIILRAWKDSEIY